MKHPVHPGRVVRELCLEPLGLTVTAAAAGLGVSRRTLNRLLTEQTAMNAEMALRLDMGFGSNASTWLSMQNAYDLAAAKKRMHGIRIKRLKATRQPSLSDSILRIQESVAALPARDARSADELIGYDDGGLP